MIDLAPVSTPISSFIVHFEIWMLQIGLSFGIIRERSRLHVIFLIMVTVFASGFFINFVNVFY